MAQLAQLTDSSFPHMSRAQNSRKLSGHEAQHSSCWFLAEALFGLVRQQRDSTCFQHDTQADEAPHKSSAINKFSTFSFNAMNLETLANQAVTCGDRDCALGIRNFSPCTHVFFSFGRATAFCGTRLSLRTDQRCLVHLAFLAHLAGAIGRE